MRRHLLDSGPVAVLAVIAAVGSFTHISSLAAKHGQPGWQSWAVAVCIDLMCVMATRELQRDKRTGRPRRGLVSWPGLVLAGGIVLTLAANLAEAEPTAWGWITSATPAVAFLVAVSMLERRSSHQPQPPEDDLITRARQIAEEHATPLTWEVLSERLDVAPDVAFDLLTRIRRETAHGQTPEEEARPLPGLQR